MPRFAVDISPPLGDDLAVFGVGDVLRKLRKDRAWTLDDLAQASGVSRTTLWELENGKTDTRGSTLKRIAQAFGLDRLPEPSELAPSLELVPRPKAEPHRDPLTDPDHRASTDGVTIPKGDAADDPATARIRELESRIEAQDRKIAALQNVLDALVRSAAEQRQPRKAASDTPRRGKRDR